MSRWVVTFPLVAIAATVAPPGCGREQDVSPPDIVYGQTECDSCRMIISEESFAAAAVLVTADGVRKSAFDDIGCLLGFLKDQPPNARAIAYVHDHPSRRWLDASTATFVRSDALQTPMASHLAACQSQADAEALLRRYAGAVLTLDQLRSDAGSGRASHPSANERSSP